MPAPTIDTAAVDQLRNEQRDIDAQIKALTDKRNAVSNQITALYDARWAGEFDLNDPETFRAACTDRPLTRVHEAVREHYEGFSALVNGFDGSYTACTFNMPIPRVRASRTTPTDADLDGVRALAAFITDAWETRADADPTTVPFKDGMILMSAHSPNIDSEMSMYVHPTQDKATVYTEDRWNGERMICTGTLRAAFEALTGHPVEGDDQ